MRAALALAFVVCCSAVAHANESDAFYAAAALEEQGRTQDAVDAYLAIVARAPADVFADDALIEAARLYEEKLGQPARAADTYERLARDYPHSRLAMRAERRAAALRTGMGPGGRDEAALAAWNDILNRFPERSRRESIALAEQLLAAHPDFSVAPRVSFWLAGLYQLEGDTATALARYRDVQARWPADEWAPRARRGEGDLLVALGRFDDAERVYAGLRGTGDPVSDRAYAEAMDDLHTARTLVRLGHAAWVFLGLFLVAALVALVRTTGSARAALAALARPPLELWYLLPVAALLVAAGQSENESIALAVLIMAGAMLAITWISGASLDAARRAGHMGAARVLAHGLGAAAAMFAAAFLTVRAMGLYELILHTLKFGVD